MMIISEIIFFILLKKKSNTSSYQNYNNYSFCITNVDNHTNNVYKHRYKERERSFVIDIEYDSVCFRTRRRTNVSLSLFLPKIILYRYTNKYNNETVVKNTRKRLRKN